MNSLNFSAIDPWLVLGIVVILFITVGGFYLYCQGFALTAGSRVIDIKLPLVDSRVPPGAITPLTDSEMASRQWLAENGWPFPMPTEAGSHSSVGVANQEPWDRWSADRARAMQAGQPMIDRINQVEREVLGGPVEWMAQQSLKPSQNPVASQQEPSENPLGFPKGSVFVSAVGIAPDGTTRQWGGFMELDGSKFRGFGPLLDELCKEVARNMTRDASGLPISPDKVALTAFTPLGA